MKLILLLCLILFTSNLFAQFTDDAERLKEMSYMKYAKDVDCENTTGTNLEHRICLNLEFQEVDSILNVVFNDLLDETTDKRLKKKYIKYQKQWIRHRNLQSNVASKGYNGHMLGIRYLDIMVLITQNRIEEIQYIRKEV